METVADKIIAFCSEVDCKAVLPPGISVMNPFRNDPGIMTLVCAFYKKFYNDNRERHLILGINPGRFGAGVTGIPFTDTHRLREKCGIPFQGFDTFETSSVFIYEMIEKYGGPEKFYSDFYISSVCPLGFTSAGKSGREVNYNYYDSKKLTESVYDFMIESIAKQVDFGIKRDTCFCLGTGKNYSSLSSLNEKFHFFDKIVSLEHPRYIMQYKSKKKLFYLSKYLEEFGKL
jgi:hypothetical protein